MKKAISQKKLFLLTVGICFLSANTLKSDEISDMKLELNKVIKESKVDFPNAKKCINNAKNYDNILLCMDIIEEEKSQYLIKKRKEKEKLEKQKILEKEKLEKQKILKKEKLEKQKILEKEKLEKQKILEKEKLEKQKILEKEKLEKQKILEKEKLEKRIKQNLTPREIKMLERRKRFLEKKKKRAEKARKLLEQMKLEQKKRLKEIK